jgi:hypothetical protein
MIYPDGTLSPASKALDEAIDLSLEDDWSPYPHCASFLDIDMSGLDSLIDEAFEKGFAAVIVFEDGSFQVLDPPPGAPNPELEPLY